MLKYLPLIVIACSGFFSCNNKPVSKGDILFEHIDTTVNPANDFFEYANGGWLKKNPIPADQSSWGIVELVNEETLTRLKEINERASKANAKEGTTEQKIGDFWSTAMDSSKIEELGLKPLKPYIDKINAISDIKSLMTISAELKNIGSFSFFLDFPLQDDMNSNRMVYKLWQGGIGLPEREYYFKSDPATVNIRNEYIKYIIRIFSLSGEDSAASTRVAKDILAVETKLAQASRKKEDLRDPYKNYNKMAVIELRKKFPSFSWTSFFSITGINKIDTVIVGQPEFFKSLNNLLTSTPLNVWKNYMKFHLISDFSSYLPDKFGATAFSFKKLFTGATERKPRWKRVIEEENEWIGELLGQLYVKAYFSEAAKNRYENMVEDIGSALKERIGKLDWMSDTAKQKAYNKLAAMKRKVGYPEKWIDFRSMKIGKESFVQNRMNTGRWLRIYIINKLGSPVNRDEWHMLPQEFNAYYNPYNNEIVLPAANFSIPSLKDDELDDAFVYGYMGTLIIGHEITHGFDDEGRKFDAFGNLVNWWTKKDEEEFNKRAAMIIKQYDEYEPLPGYHINGKLTMGENIADLGGILISLDAFKKTEQYKKGKKINGFTPMQRFFLAYAMQWMENQKEEAVRNNLLTDVHAPYKYHVNGPLVNVDEFYSAFHIKPGDKMYRADSLRVRIW